jgi:hypothetical protein
MRYALKDAERRFLEELNARGVRYMVVGLSAVIPALEEALAAIEGAAVDPEHQSTDGWTGRVDAGVCPRRAGRFESIHHDGRTARAGGSMDAPA